MKTRALTISLMVILTMAVSASAFADKQIVLHAQLAEKSEQLIHLFEEENPNIKVEIIPGYGSDWDKWAVEMAGGVAPDIIGTFYDLPVRAMHEGFSLNLQPYIERDDWHDILGDFAPAQLDLVSKEGRIYGLPIYTPTGTVFYNRRMFEETGVMEPTGSWNWDEFMAVASRFTKYDAEGKLIQWGYQQYPMWLWIFHWFAQGGVSFDDPARVPLNTPEAINTMDFLQDAFARDIFQMGWSGPFSNDEVAMMYSGSWEMTVIDAGIPMGFTLVPEGPAGRTTLTTSDIYCINSQTKYPDESWELLKWWYSEEIQLRWIRLNRRLQPPRISLAYEWLAIQKDAWPHARNFEAFIKSSEYAMAQPMFSDPTVIGQYIEPALQQIMRLEVAPGPTLRSMSETATQYLKGTIE